MSEFEEEILAEISQWAFSKYGIAAMTMDPQNLSKEFWKEKLE
jgi:hypothetical protein